MTARDDAIEAALDQMWTCCADCAKEPVNRDANRPEAERLVEAVDPIIRADERAKAHVHNTGTSSPDACCECCYDVHSLERDHLAARRRVKELLDERKHLRAQVEVLRDRVVVVPGPERQSASEASFAAYSAVLALLGGESE